MSENWIIALLGLITTVGVATLAYVMTFSNKLSKLCGQYETHLTSCEERFKTLEHRIDNLDLQIQTVETQEVEQ